MQIIAILFSLVAFACAIIILIDAFKNAVWKGIVGLLCGFYLLYYAIVEFQHEKKWTIIGGWIGAGVIAGILNVMSAGSAVAAAQAR